MHPALPCVAAWVCSKPSIPPSLGCVAHLGGSCPPLAAFATHITD